MGDTCLPCWSHSLFSSIRWWPKPPESQCCTICPSQTEVCNLRVSDENSKQHVGNSPIQNIVFQVRLKCQETNKYILMEDLFQEMATLKIIHCYLHFKLEEHPGSCLFSVLSFIKSGNLREEKVWSKECYRNKFKEN